MTRYCASCNNPKPYSIIAVGNDEFCKICRAATKSYNADQPRSDISSSGSCNIPRLEGSGSTYPIAKKPIPQKVLYTEEQQIEQIWKKEANIRIEIVRRKESSENAHERREAGKIKRKKRKKEKAKKIRFDLIFRDEDIEKLPEQYRARARKEMEQNIYRESVRAMRAEEKAKEARRQKKAQ